MPPKKLQIELQVHIDNFRSLSSMLQKFFLHKFNTFMVHVYIHIHFTTTGMKTLIYMYFVCGILCGPE